LLELVELMNEKDTSKLSDVEKQGRQSGALAWRLSRGEAGGEQKPTASVIWRPTEDEIKAGVFHLEV
jgi:hypothetical protein